MFNKIIEKKEIKKNSLGEKVKLYQQSSTFATLKSCLKYTNIFKDVVAIIDIL